MLRVREELRDEIHLQASRVRAPESRLASQAQTVPVSDGKPRDMSIFLRKTEERKAAVLRGPEPMCTGHGLGDQPASRSGPSSGLADLCEHTRKPDVWALTQLTHRRCALGQVTSTSCFSFLICQMRVQQHLLLGVAVNNK